MPFFPVLRIFLLLIGIVSATAFASTARGQVVDSVKVGSCIARDTGNLRAEQLFAKPSAFTCVPADRQHRFGSGDYWMLSDPLPATVDPKDLRIRVRSLWQQALTLHVLYSDGHIARVATTSATLSRKVQVGGGIEFRLPARSARVSRLLWHVEGASNARGILLGQRILTTAQSHRSNLIVAAVYAAFVGMAAALLVYNIGLWAALRYRFQLAYSAMVACLLAYAISSSAGPAWFFPEIDNNDRLRINYLLLGFSAASALTFARSYFEEHVFEGWAGRTTAAAIVLVAVSGVLYALLSYVDPRFADRLYSIALMLGLAGVGPILWRAWRRGSAFLWLFAVAWAVPIVFAITRTLAALHLVPSGFWLDHSTVMSLAFEALISSLAIAYRVQMLSRERDEARAGEIEARELADADPLTGLLNRRAFLTQAIGRPGPQLLHLIDLDHFKAINETLGHDGGDEVLRVFARTLRTLVPPEALVARIGGEEFAIIADVDTAIDADGVLGRLRGARMPFDLSVTSSIGSCVGPLACEIDWKALYRCADRALFEAKAAGRDRARRAMPLAA